MESEDFIELSPDDASENAIATKELLESNNQPLSKGGDFSENDRDESIGVGGGEDENHRQEEEFIRDDRQHPVVEENVELVNVGTNVECNNVPEQSHNEEDSCTITLTSERSGDISVLGVKRARMTFIDQQPTVHVIYSSLTRESKKKLKELLQQWSEWHAIHESSSSNDFSPESLECGEETYFPALHVGQEKSSVTFWMDNQPGKEENKEHLTVDSDVVPLYDRGYVLGSTSLDGSNSERLETLEASRCFNCGSYSHALKDCPRPRDNVAITNARKQHSAKKNSNIGARGQSRYYQKSPGKFDDLKAGVLGPETRACLGIGEFDPPPWLQRMREMGYPPGYLDVEESESQPSGITIFEDEEIKLEFEEGELPEQGEPVPLEKKMSVEFPGINAPIPENADHRRWAPPTHTFVSDSSRNRFQHNSGRSEAHRACNQDQRRPREFGDHNIATDNGPVSSTYAHSPRYSPYDRNPLPRSPNLSRSVSDRGWRSPATHDGSPSHGLQSPPSYNSGLHRQSTPHYRSATNFERWAPDNVSPDASSLSRDRDWHDRDQDWHDHRYHHRR